MREIKFRAWGRYLGDDNPSMSESFTVPEVCNECGTFNGPAGVDMHDEYKLMQYTGIKDRSGVEVYEGDVLDIKTGSKREDYKGVVVYESGGFWAYSSLDERATGWSFPDMVGLFRGFSFEVIGNIYQNPELLEK